MVGGGSGSGSGKQQRGFSLNPKDYKLMEEVGHGASAVVYRAIYLPTNEVVAIKCLDLDRCNSNLVRFLQPFIPYQSGEALLELMPRLLKLCCSIQSSSCKAFVVLEGLRLIVLFSRALIILLA